MLDIETNGITPPICVVEISAQKNAWLVARYVELCYIRSVGMGLSQPALGKLMSIDGQSIARWAKSDKVPCWVNKLVRLLYAIKPHCCHITP